MAAKSVITKERFPFALGMRGTDPNAHEPVFEDDPRQQEDEGLVAAVERGHVGGG